MQLRSQQTETKHIQAPVEPKAVAVTTAVQIAEAKEIHLSGDFNDWLPASLRPNRRQANGRWETRLVLPPGRYEFKFVVDAEWGVDPVLQQDVVDAFGSINSFVEVRV